MSSPSRHVLRPGTALSRALEGAGKETASVDGRSVQSVASATLPIASPSHGAPWGWWTPEGAAKPVDGAALASALEALHVPVLLARLGDDYALVNSGQAILGDAQPDEAALPLAAHVPALTPECLGDPAFCADLGIRYPYMAGAMANGIASEALVEAFARAGLVGFFGAAGLSLKRIEQAIDRLQKNLGELPFGFNLIHAPHEPRHEAAVVDLYLRRGVRLVEASAYLDLTLPLVKYRVSGLREDDAGRVVAPNRIVAKVSRTEVATKFFSPPPEKMLEQLVAQGAITAAQAQLAKRIPMAQDLTAEADSGGHTDNRPALAMVPTMLALRDRMQAEFRYDTPLRVGAGGGVATPASTLAMFNLGAAYVLTGTVNQACVESGSSDRVRAMLAEARQADIAMAPAADMFEMGVKVQVLKRGTMFAMRAAKLYELYRSCESLEALPAAERAQLEKTVFRASLDEIWAQTKAFFLDRDPVQVERAERDAQHKMALVFRWYLGQSSGWANRGDEDRQVDYQIWCGPAMGAFNEWAAGSFLQEPAARRAETVALNLLYGAAVLARTHALRAQGVRLPDGWTPGRPLEREELLRRLQQPAQARSEA